jgi:hypothetical protein
MAHRPAAPAQAYLSAIRDLTSADAEESLRKKREQQAALADALRHQIEEKERRKATAAAHFTFGRGQSSAAPSGLGIPDTELAPTVIPAETKQPSKPPRKQLLTRADLSQFELFSKTDFSSRGPIAISTESPLAASTFPTPPPGFSMRGLSVVEPVMRLPERKANPEVKTRAKSMIASHAEPPQATKLDGESELIYPDGHRSPLPSPRSE